jgi:lysozyme
MRTLGIDVSHHQGDLNWNNVAAGGVEFSFIKATEGTGFVDNRFELNWQRAQEVGLFRGAYHFGRPGSDPGAQAAHFHAVVGALGFRDLPPALDLEVSDGHSAADVTAWAKEFLTRATQLFGRTPIIYTGQFWREVMKNPNDAFFGQHPLWLAGYVPEGNLRIPAAWSHFTFWQYTDGVHNGPQVIAGVPRCDQNLFEGSPADLDRLCSNDSPPGPPVPGSGAGNQWPGVYLLWRRSPAQSGGAVRKWQQRMKDLGFVIDVDGAYGPQSKGVCQTFQKSLGLPPDGIVGPKTWEAAFAG